MNNFRIGFVGCGRHAKANIYPSLSLLGVKLTSVCAKHIENARAVAQQYGIPSAYGDHLEMLKKEKLDAVFVVMPTSELNAKVVEDCLYAGAHVFVEKPLGATVAGATHVAKVSAKTGKHVMTGFMKRFAPAYVESKRIAEEHDKFGDILSLTGMFGVRNFGNEETYVQYASIHFVDLIRFLVGDIDNVSGFSNSRNENTDLAFSFSTKSGRVGNMFFAGLPSWARHYEETIITGSHGFVKAENMRKVIVHTVDKDLKPAAPRWQLIDEEDRVLTTIDTSGSGGWRDLYLNGYVGEVQHFLKSLSLNQAPSPSAEDNVKTMEFYQRILKISHV